MAAASTEKGIESLISLQSFMSGWLDAFSRLTSAHKKALLGALSFKHAVGDYIMSIKYFFGVWHHNFGKKMDFL